jgi:hypothetical protein
MVAAIIVSTGEEITPILARNARIPRSKTANPLPYRIFNRAKN